jgi:hypothetical protein
MKPVELLKLKGTIDKRVPKNNVESNLPVLEYGTKIEIPKSLTTKRIKELWSSTIEKFILWRVLAEPDLMEIEQSFILLQDLDKINIELKKMNPSDDGYEKLFNLKIKSIKTFHEILKNYGLSAAARTKLALLNSETKKNEVTILDKIKNQE